MLMQTLQSICAQDYDIARIEACVVTQNARLEPDTLPPADRLAVKVVHRPEQDTISTLRNTGVEQTTGEYVAFLDADIELAPNWIETMLEELRAKPGRVLVSAVQRCADDAPPIEQIRTALSSGGSDAAVRFLPGANLFLKRETFFAAGGFPAHLATCEDYYFTDQVHKLGEMYFTSRSSFIHLGEDKAFDQMFKKEIWRGQSNLQSLRGRHVPLSELPSLLSPLWVGFFLLSAALSLLLLSLGKALLMLAFAMIPVLLYAFRLHRIAGDKVAFDQIVKFYVIYFPARAIGLSKGLIKMFSV